MTATDQCAILKFFDACLNLSLRIILRFSKIFNIYQSQYSCRVHSYKKYVEGKIYGNRNKLQNVLSPLSKGGEPKLIKISKWKEPKKIGVGETKRGEDCQKTRGETDFLTLIQG